MRRIRLIVAYDGTDYCGWQIQPNGVTIEEVLNRELSDLTGETILVIGASRTDSGVHAKGNVAVFDTDSEIPPDRFSYALNQKLPEDIVVTKSEEVPLTWHPRYRPCRKTYEYHVLHSRLPDPLLRRTTYQVSYPLDLGEMRQAASYLIGEHDFVSFCNIRSNTEDTVRTLYRLDISEQGEELIFTFCGNGFLYNMIRIIVGTLLRVGRGFYPPEKVKEILDQKNRETAGMTVPPQGLILTRIDYEDEEEREREGEEHGDL